MEANDIQIGGDHYKADYQHWDWVDDIGLHYYLAAATKYISRWQKKNGIQDLRKALHFITKSVEKDILTRTNSKDVTLTKKFAKQLDSFSAECVYLIIDGYYERASNIISNKISELEFKEQQ